MSEAQLQEIELDIEDAKYFVDKRDALLRLYQNADFKQIISEGYFREEAIRNVAIKCAPDYRSEEAQAAILQAIDAIGALQNYFRVIEMQANVAADSIQTYEDEVQEILNEDTAQEQI